MTRILLAALFLTGAHLASAQSVDDAGFLDSIPEYFVEVTKSAEAGDMDAQYALGSIYHFSKDPKQRDLHEAARWYELAARQGHVEAQDYLGLFYSGGIGGLPVDCAKSIEWYTKAAEGGSLGSWGNVAWKLATCEDATLRDGARALEILREQAEHLPQNAGTLDTLAAAHAAVGDFEEAKALQFGAIALIEHRGQEERLEAFRERLRLYENGETWKGASYEEPQDFR